MLALLGLALAWALACGGAHAGDGCSNDNTFTCADPHTALECETGHWRAVACDGPGGCAERDGQVSCDPSLDGSGDPCSTAQDGESICASDGGAVLECRGGLWTQTRTCACSRQGSQLVCP